MVALISALFERVSDSRANGRSGPHGAGRLRALVAVPSGDSGSFRLLRPEFEDRSLNGRTRLHSVRYYPPVGIRLYQARRRWN
jgi:hypothetical protein